MPARAARYALAQRATESDRSAVPPQVFKMTALRGLKLIFPADVNPLYAGFGNNVGDMVAYAKASGHSSACAAVDLLLFVRPATFW